MMKWMNNALRPLTSVRTLALLSALVCGGSGARADLVAGINTGVDAVGNPLASGAIDPHYQLISSADPNALGPNAYVVQTGQFPFPAWYANGASQWIAPYANGTTASDGTYVYQTTFDLTGFDISTALITGKWATDNNGLDILINGISTGNTTASNSFQGPPTNFLINSGFVAGLNTLEFRVNNAVQSRGNPTGLRVEGFVTAQAVPEPASLAMLASGGLFAFRAARRRKNNTVGGSV